MANRAYLSLWCRDFSAATMAERFTALLETLPASAERPGVASLLVRAVDFAESPLAEYRFQTPADSADLALLLSAHSGADLAWEAEAHWDIWTWDAAGAWARRPERLEISCYGPEFDAGEDEGQFRAALGFEHLFTGHGGLLGFGAPHAAPEDAAEAEFLAAMQEPARLREYQQKTQENVRQLLDWTRLIETALPLERYLLWSEGEENFEARLDDILAVR